MGEIIVPDTFGNKINEGEALVAFYSPNVFEESDFNKMVKPGNVLAVDDDKNLPIYPSMRDFILDVIESDFNPDIDRTLHFLSEDLPNIQVWKCKPLGDLRDTAHSTIKLAYAIMLLEPLNMDQLQADVKLAGAKYGKIIQYKERDDNMRSDAASRILQGIDTSGMNIPSLPKVEDKKEDENKDQ